MATIELRTAPLQRGIAIREDCTLDQIGSAVGRLLQEVYSWATAHGVTVTGPAFTRYLDWRDNGGTIEAGFVTAGAGKVNDARVHDVELGGGQAAYTLHVGSYEKLARTYEDMTEWIKARALTPAPAMWECYLDPPGVPPDEQRTELWWPVETAQGARTNTR